MLSILETLWPETFWAETFWAGFVQYHLYSEGSAPILFPRLLIYFSQISKIRGLLKIAEAQGGMG